MNRALDESISGVLEQLVAGSTELLGEEGYVRLEPEKYYDGPHSNIWRVRVEGSSQVTHIFIKQIKPRDGGTARRRRLAEKLERDFTNTSRLYHIFKQHPNHGVIHPIAVFPDKLVTVSEAAEGVNFGEVLRRHARLIPSRKAQLHLQDSARRCGEWLMTFQRLGSPMVSPGRFDLEGMKRYIDVRLTRLVETPSSGFNSSLRRRILHSFDSLAAKIRDKELQTAIIHGDFCPSNVLVNGSDVVGLDFVMMREGSKYHDLSRFYHQLELLTLNPYFRRAVIRKIQHAFLMGYSAGVEPSQPLFRLFLLQHTACHLLGLVRMTKSPIHERVYNDWIRRRHLRFLSMITGRR